MSSHLSPVLNPGLQNLHSNAMRCCYNPNSCEGRKVKCTCWLTDQLSNQYCVRPMSRTSWEEEKQQLADWTTGMSVNMCTWLSSPHSCWGCSYIAEHLSGNPAALGSRPGRGEQIFSIFWKLLLNLLQPSLQKAKIVRNWEGIKYLNMIN